MLSSVLRSERAVQVNIAIMRTFVRLRQWIVSNEELARKLTAMERNYDSQFMKSNPTTIEPSPAFRP